MNKKIENMIVDALTCDNTIPNYLKAFIKTQVMTDAADTGEPVFHLDQFKSDLAGERVVKVFAIWNDGDDDEDDITVDGLPLKFSQEDVDAKLAQMFPDRPGIFAEGIQINFDGCSFYTAIECFPDNFWRDGILANGSFPIDLDEHGDASAICTDVGDDVRRIDDRFDYV